MTKLLRCAAPAALRGSSATTSKCVPGGAVTTVTTAAATASAGIQRRWRWMPKRLPRRQQALHERGIPAAREVGREGGAGPHDRRADAGAVELEAQRAREPFEPPLARGVAGLERARRRDVLGRDEDEIAARRRARAATRSCGARAAPGPIRFVAISRWTSAAATSCSRPGMQMPALLTSTSAGPSARSQASKKASIDARSLEIERERGGATARLLDLARDLAELVRAPRAERDRPAERAEARARSRRRCPTTRR